MSITFELMEYSIACTDTKIVKIDELYDDIFVHIPICDAKFLELESIYELTQDSTPKYIEFMDKVIRERHTPWLQIDVDLLNLSAGYHIFQFRFRNTINDTSDALYLTYNIQTDRPDKSNYIYMQRGDSNE